MHQQTWRLLEKGPQGKVFKSCDIKGLLSYKIGAMFDEAFSFDS